MGYLQALDGVPVSVWGGGVLALGGWLTAEVQKEDLHAHMPRAAAAVFARQDQGLAVVTDRIESGLVTAACHSTR